MRTLKRAPVLDILATMAEPHSPYAEIDPAIERWITAHGLELCRKWQGEARFWHTSRGNQCASRSWRKATSLAETASVERGSVVVSSFTVGARQRFAKAYVPRFPASCDGPTLEQ